MPCAAHAWQNNPQVTVLPSYYLYNLMPNQMLFANPRNVREANRVVSSRSSLSLHYELIMQTDGNLALYKYVPRRGFLALWASNTVGRGGIYTHMQADGNLVMYDGRGRAIWASNMAGRPGAYLTMQHDGNAVIYVPRRNGSLQPIWATGTNER